MNIDHYIDHGHLILRPQGARIDAFEALDFKETVRQMSAEHELDVALWLDHVTFIDSSGLGSIVGAMKRIAPARKLQLIELQPTVKRVFELTQMSKVFNIFDDFDHFASENTP